MNNKRKQLILKNSKINDSYDYKKKKFNNCNNKNRKQQKFVVYIVNIMRIKKNEYCYNIVNRVTKKFKKTL